jgi:uncharacterized cupredoxin-like copper-binding protein
MRTGPTRLLTPAVAVAALALAAAGCGGSSKKSSSSTPKTSSKPAAAAPTGGGATVTENASDFKFSQPKATAKSGTVTVKLDNKGQTAHAISVEGNGISEKKTSTISPGQTTSLKVKLRPGKYEFYCPVDGHKQLGMKGELTVQ